MGVGGVSSRIWCVSSQICHLGLSSVGFAAYLVGFGAYPVGFGAYPVGFGPYPVGLGPYPVGFEGKISIGALDISMVASKIQWGY